MRLSRTEARKIVHDATTLAERGEGVLDQRNIIGALNLLICLDDSLMTLQRDVAGFKRTADGLLAGAEELLKAVHNIQSTLNKLPTKTR